MENTLDDIAELHSISRRSGHVLPPDDVQNGAWQDALLRAQRLSERQLIREAGAGEPSLLKRRCAASELPYRIAHGKHLAGLYWLLIVKPLHDPTDDFVENIQEAILKTELFQASANVSARQ